MSKPMSKYAAKQKRQAEEAEVLCPHNIHMYNPCGKYDPPRGTTNPVRVPYVPPLIREDVLPIAVVQELDRAYGQHRRNRFLGQGRR